MYTTAIPHAAIPAHRQAVAAGWSGWFESSAELRQGLQVAEVAWDEAAGGADFPAELLHRPAHAA